MRYLLATGLVLVLLGAVWTGQAQAECKVIDATPTYTAGQLKDLTCDTSGLLQVEVVSGAGGGMATADPPTYVEGTNNSSSMDLAGNTRVTLGTLLSGEDQTNNLLMTSGGVARLTTFSSVTSATSSSVTTVPTGAKTFVAAMAAGASESTAFTLTVYGNWTNSTTAAIPVCTMTVPAATTALIVQDFCPSTEANYSYWFYTASVYTSTSGKALTVYASY